MERKSICIIGTGLIGGSLAIQLHEKKISSRLIGVETNQLNAEAAIRLELVDEILDLDDAIAQSEVIILAIPVDVGVKLLPAVLDKISNQIVVDVGSTKSELVEKAKQHEKRGRFVATHPMWGTEYSGPTAAVRGAFENKAVIICNAEESDADAIDLVKNFYKWKQKHMIYMLPISVIFLISLHLHWTIRCWKKRKKKMQYLNWPPPVLKAR